MDLFLSVADALGFATDGDLARLADVTPDNVPNWRGGAVKEFKLQTLAAVKRALEAQIRGLAQRAASARDAHKDGLHPIVIEAGASPDDLLRQFRDRVGFDYLGHRFLYYEPQGALAWMSLIQDGYEQDAWVRGTRAAATAWLDPAKDRHGRVASPLARALGVDRKGALKGIDVIGLGCGDGAKEAAVLEQILALAGDRHLEWLHYVPVDVSIPLLVRAATRGAEAIASAAPADAGVRYAQQPVCADFEEGDLRFMRWLPTATRPVEDGARLILLLGNTFGNLRDEERFIRQRLWRVTRPGDLVWLEVGLVLEPIALDPLFRLTEPKNAETASEASRRMLLQGPFRRWEAAMGRAPADLGLRVWLRSDDASCQVPGAVNFCHDLILPEQGRVCTMLYSRRYRLDHLTTWLEERELAVERVHTVHDGRRHARVAHLLLRRKARSE
ncbi:MAG: L-histidine N(alpha)-methyltransferase [Myxococcales bacterium]|nr:L-histidine N(alpha)-methyltransferase [Myxococcales bacterium]